MFTLDQVVPWGRSFEEYGRMFLLDEPDLALCSHLLFLYSAQLDAAFHRAAVLELARVSREVRIFPLLALDGQRSPHVDATVTALVEAGCDVSIEAVPYEFQRGGNQTMRFRRRDA